MFDSFISEASARYRVPEAWIRAVIEVESGWNPEAYNPNDPTGAWGLMQLLYRTAQGLGYEGDPTGLFDPETNIDLGAKLLGQLRIQYGDDFRRIYSAYNSGNPDLWETSTQVYNNVMRALEALQAYLPVVSAGAILVLAVAAVWMFRKGF